MRPRSLVLPLLTVSLAAALVAGCSSSPARSSTGPSGDRPDRWIQASPILQGQIDDHAERLPYLQKIEDFRDEIAWFVQVGEPAYPTLLYLAEDEDPKVAGTALAALAGSADSRLVPFLAEIPWPAEDQPKLRYERARCHVKLGDWQPMGVLVEGLDDPDLWNRALCFKALRDETNQTFDYHPRLEGEEREASLAQWRAWLDQRSLDPMLR